LIDENKLRVEYLVTLFLIKVSVEPEMEDGEESAVEDRAVEEFVKELESKVI
jgi:hypothetical protein